MSEELLKITNLHKEFRRKRVLKDISYTFENGIYGLLGPNGAGKTTLMRCIVNLYDCKDGSILYKGSDIKVCKSYGQNIGYLPQKFGLFKELSVYDIMKYFGSLKNIDEKSIDNEILRCLKLVNLEEWQYVKCKKLSGGMIRRLGIAQAIMGKPDIIIFDEPTTGLDPEERLRFKLLISQLGKDAIILISTHIVEDVEAVSDTIILMNDGEIIESMSTKEIKDLAKGKVYEVPFGQTDSLKGNFYIEKQYEKEDGIYCKVLSSEDWMFPKLSPVVEDGYICRIKNI